MSEGSASDSLGAPTRSPRQSTPRVLVGKFSGVEKCVEETSWHFCRSCRCLSPNLLMNLMLCGMLLNKRSSPVGSSSRCMCTTSAPSSGRSYACGGARWSIINSAFRSALQNLLKQLLRQPGQYQYEVEDEAEALAQAWFTDQEAKKQVSETLSRF